MLELARRLAATLGSRARAGADRRVPVGDIRHCFADVSLARQALGYEPRVGLDEGLAELAAWLEGRVAVDRVESASRELAERGLTF